MGLRIVSPGGVQGLMDVAHEVHDQGQRDGFIRHQCVGLVMLEQVDAIRQRDDNVAIRNGQRG